MIFYSKYFKFLGCLAVLPLVLAVVIPFPNIFPRTLPQDETRADIKLLSLLKAGDGSSIRVWHYSGIIRNPLTGFPIAGVEGLEKVQAVSDHYNPDKSESNSNSTANIYKKSYVSEKVFVYTDLDDRTTPMKQFRVGKFSPKREINPVIRFSEIVTLTCTEEAGKPFVVITWPGGRITETYKFNVTCLKGNWLQRFPIFKSTCLEVMNNMRAVKKRRIGRFISFAPTGSGDCGRTQEYYTIRQDPFHNSAVMSYRQYGECPPSFSVGRACNLGENMF